MRRARTRLPDAVLGDAGTTDSATDRLAALVDVRTRMAGHEGETAGAAVVAAGLADAGLDVERERFDIDGWWRGSSSLAVDRSVSEAGRDPDAAAATDAEATTRDRYAASHEVIALPGSPAATATGRVVDVGAGRPADFEGVDLAGAVAMASSDTPAEHGRWIHRMEKYVAAAEAGAAAFVFRNHAPGALPPTGEVGYGTRPGPIPAVGVSKEVGERVRRHAGDGAARATVTVDCETGPATSVNVVGRLPTTGRTGTGTGDGGGATDVDDEVVLVTAHHDAHDVAEGAVDNAAGCATVVEVGRLLADAVDAGLDLGCEVRCVTFGAEEIGLRGADHLAAALDPDRIRCVLNVDGVARARDLRAVTNGHVGVERTLAEAAAAVGQPLATDDALLPHGDQWAFVRRGVPGVMISADADDRGRGWGHTHADTLDKIDGRDLRAHAAFVAEAAARAAAPGTSYAHRTPADVRDALDEGYERELRAGGRWPFET